MAKQSTKCYEAPAPSRVARAVAEYMWGNPVQNQSQVATGTYEFSTPGHGGFVAVLDHAPIPPEIAQRIRERDVFRVRVLALPRQFGWGGDGARMYYGCQLAIDPSESDVHKLGEIACDWIDCMVGEEDAAWAVMMAVAPDILAGYNAHRAKTWNGRPITREEVLDCVARWHAKEYNQLVAPEHQIASQDIA